MEPDLEPVVGEQAGHELDDSVVCRRCRAELTRGDLAVERSGSHLHTFRNPAGYSWTIRCFADAPGCASVGELTAEASWFAGYEWCFAACGACGQHLGWWFVGAGPSFVGLISTRVEGG